MAVDFRKNQTVHPVYLAGLATFLIAVGIGSQGALKAALKQRSHHCGDAPR
jgi:hypothetical protein